jgi:anhydro-N-acetylmuramic acid kinase
MISGTSMDGIDVAAADFRFAGDTLEMRPLGAESREYSAPLRSALAALLPPASTTAAEVCRLDTLVGQEFAAAAVHAVDALAGGSAELIVSHGQTIFHWVDDAGRARGTLQIGQPAWIAEATGVPVVADLRARDVALGGHGAPLASTFDHLLLAGSGEPAAALNLGGIANVTVVGSGPTVAFDIGPGNALIDAAVSHASGGAEAFDRDGARARRGSVDADLLARLLAEPYYGQPPPKSTGKELFHLVYLLDHIAAVGAVEPDNVVATVTALTAVTVADACRAFDVRRLVVSGGGVDNPALMERLTAELPGVAITTIDEYGVPAGAKEAYLFALIGFLSVHQLPGNVASATGAAGPAVLGCVVPGRGGFPVITGRPSPPSRLVIVGGPTRPPEGVAR